MSPVSARPSASPLLLLVVLVISSMLQLARAGAWLSFNQNTGGLDRLSALHGKSIAEAVNSGELATEGEQLAGLLRMCRERAKRSLARNAEHLDELCSALFKMAREERRRKRQQRALEQPLQVQRRFVPVAVDDDEEAHLLWWN